MDEPRHPVGPEIDDSGNPTAASPEEDPATAGPSLAGTDDEQAGQSRRSVTGREMLAQLQQMIDTLAVQATPVVREVAAKAAELAAVAGAKAGPLAHRAAEATEKVGERVAVRSKEVAAELRAAQAQSAAEAGATPPEDLSAEQVTHDETPG